jgi:hypothetical protein
MVWKREEQGETFDGVVSHERGRAFTVVPDRFKSGIP